MHILFGPQKGIASLAPPEEKVRQKPSPCLAFYCQAKLVTLPAPHAQVSANLNALMSEANRPIVY